MEITKETRPVFVVNGKEFLTEEGAKSYLEKIKYNLKHAFYPVHVEPDLTEGRGYYNQIIVATEGRNLNAVMQYLFVKYGGPIAHVMGVSPIANWRIGEPVSFNEYEELQAFLEKKVPMGIGSYSEKKARPVVYIDNAGNIRSSETNTNLRNLFK